MIDNFNDSRSTAACVSRRKEATIGEPKRVIGDALRSRTSRRQATEVAIAVNALNLEIGRPMSVRLR